MDDPTVPDPAPPDVKGLEDRGRLTAESYGWLVVHVNAWLVGRWYPELCRHCGETHRLHPVRGNVPSWGPPYVWWCPRCDVADHRAPHPPTIALPPPPEP